MINSPSSGRAYNSPDARSVYELLRSRANQTPEAIAIMAPGRVSLTYARLFCQVEKTVAALRSFGLNRNDRIAIVLPDGPEMAVAFVAVAATATCAPLNPVYRVNEFDFSISDLQAKALIVGSESDSPAREVAQKHDIPIIELMQTLESVAGLFELKSGTRGTPDVDSFALPDDTALVLHTSGTTSRPKIVPLTHANICTSACNISATLNLQENDRCLNVMPLFHIHGLIGAFCPHWPPVRAWSAHPDSTRQDSSSGWIRCDRPGTPLSLPCSRRFSPAPRHTGKSSIGVLCDSSVPVPLRYRKRSWSSWRRSSMHL